MLDPAIESALARGVTIVTPNKRLARHLVARYDGVQRSAGRACWPTARAMPWSAFVSQLWQQACDDAGPLPLQRLDAAQTAHLWHRIVARDLDAALVSSEATAALAAEAWERVHAYGAGGESWRGFGEGGSDIAAFERWAEAFTRDTATVQLIDAARLPDRLVALGPFRPLDTEVAFAGFLDRSPQRARLVRFLRACGVTVDDPDPISARCSSHARLFAAKSPSDELACAFGWARDRAQQDPACRVGVVVLDLPERLSKVRALAEDILCPASQWPGREGHSRPYELSTAGMLADVPIVACALGLIALAVGPIERAAAVELIRSRYLAEGGTRWGARASLERTWLQSGVRQLDMAAIVASLEGCDPNLAQRWRNALAPFRSASRDTPRGFAERWRSWLTSTGWCDGHRLTSAEFQANGAWNELLASFARLGSIERELRPEDAIEALRRMARATVFQPEGGGARVQVLGPLEAAGLGFDALWVAGFSSDAWPQAPAPHPLLPIRWQHDHDVPRSSPARELDYARRLTAILSHAAPEVVFSFAKRIDDRAGAPSPLVASLPAHAQFDPPVPTARRSFTLRCAHETIPDRDAPPLAPGAQVRGGAGLIDAQSTCPFRAALRYRLAVQPWPDEVTGLSPIERGVLVHAALAAFWTKTRDRATLLAMSEQALDDAISRAVDASRARLSRARWSEVPPIVAAGESYRIASLIRQWIDGVEKSRGPFAVIACEAETRRRVDFGALVLEMQFDRLDAVDGGRVAIVDYKTGRAILPAHWFDERPQGSQLAAYAVAHKQCGGARVAALVYGELRPGAIRAVGLAEDDHAWPALGGFGRLQRQDIRNWDAAQAHWEEALRSLASEIGRGEASIAPRDDRACRLCHLQPVCRIRNHRDLHAADPGSGGNLQ